jgi:hypothetical protein
MAKIDAKTVLIEYHWLKNLTEKIIMANFDAKSISMEEDELREVLCYKII